MTFKIPMSIRTTFAGLAASALLAMSAAAATLPISADLTITASVGNPVTSGSLPQSMTLTSIGAGTDFSFNDDDLITFTSSGFPQTMSGTVRVDISDGSIDIGFTGTAQGVSLIFALTNIDFGTPVMEITGASEIASSGIISGVNQTRAVSSGADSISGGFDLFGFQPGTSVTQTIAFSTALIETPEPEPIPLPATAPLLLAALGGFAYLRKRKTA